MTALSERTSEAIWASVLKAQELKRDTELVLQSSRGRIPDHVEKELFARIGFYNQKIAEYQNELARREQASVQIMPSLLAEGHSQGQAIPDSREASGSSAPPDLSSNSRALPDGYIVLSERTSEAIWASVLKAQELKRDTELVLQNSGGRIPDHVAKELFARIRFYDQKIAEYQNELARREQASVQIMPSLLAEGHPQGQAIPDSREASGSSAPTDLSSNSRALPDGYIVLSERTSEAIWASVLKAQELKRDTELVLQNSGGRILDHVAKELFARIRFYDQKIAEYQNELARREQASVQIMPSLLAEGHPQGQAIPDPREASGSSAPTDLSSNSIEPPDGYTVKAYWKCGRNSGAEYDLSEGMLYGTRLSGLTKEEAEELVQEQKGLYRDKVMTFKIIPSRQVCKQAIENEKLEIKLNKLSENLNQKSKDQALVKATDLNDEIMLYRPFGSFDELVTVFFYLIIKSEFFKNEELRNQIIRLILNMEELGSFSQKEKEDIKSRLLTKLSTAKEGYYGLSVEERKIIDDYLDQKESFGILSRNLDQYCPDDRLKAYHILIWKNGFDETYRTRIFDKIEKEQLLSPKELDQLRRVDFSEKKYHELPPEMQEAGDKFIYYAANTYAAMEREKKITAAKNSKRSKN